MEKVASFKVVRMRNTRIADELQVDRSEIVRLCRHMMLCLRRVSARARTKMKRTEVKAKRHQYGQYCIG